MYSINESCRVSASLKQIRKGFLVFKKFWMVWNYQKVSSGSTDYVILTDYWRILLKPGLKRLMNNRKSFKNKKINQVEKRAMKS